MSAITSALPYDAEALLAACAGSDAMPAQRDRFELPWTTLAQHVPRASNAHHEGRVGGGRAPLFVGYGVQEKLDGVYVLWTGRRLLTKTSTNELTNPAFTDLLPPFPLVGELYAGPRCGQNAITLTGRGGTGHPLWQQVRLVAFDVPGLPEWSYRARYELLTHVVAAWSAHLGRAAARVADRIPLADVPLWVIRHRPIQDLSKVFRAVVEAHDWKTRVAAGTDPYGIPQVRSLLPPPAGHGIRDWSLAPGHSVVLQSDAALFIADHGKPWHLLPCPYDHPAAASSGGRGEGCMLWREDAPWEPRGASERPTGNQIKYKPIVCCVATVLHDPYHTHHRNTGLAGGLWPGFVVPMRCQTERARGVAPSRRPAPRSVSHHLPRLGTALSQPRRAAAGVSGVATGLRRHRRLATRIGTCLDPGSSAAPDPRRRHPDPSGQPGRPDGARALAAAGRAVLVRNPATPGALSQRLPVGRGPVL